MPQRVQYPDSIEPLVRFIEETPRAEILDKTLEKLREGVPIPEMLKASALAVTRSSDLPPGHHGGPLHPVAGLYAISKLTERLGDDERRFLPVMQLYLMNKFKLGAWDVNTGKAIVTPADVPALEALSKQGVR